MNGFKFKGKLTVRVRGEKVASPGLMTVGDKLSELVTLGGVQ